MTKKPEFSNDYGLKKQIRAAAGSSMHNIPEDATKYAGESLMGCNFFFGRLHFDNKIQTGLN